MAVVDWIFGAGLMLDDMLAFEFNNLGNGLERGKRKPTPAWTSLTPRRSSVSIM
jgi:hypothetical protein